MTRQNEHPVGKPVGLSLPDLPVTAEPAAYLTKRFHMTKPKTSDPGRAGAIRGPGSTRRAFTAAVRPLMNDSDGNSTHCRRGWALRDAI